MATFHWVTLVMTQKKHAEARDLHKYSYIDILRGIAILGVVAVHSSLAIVDLNIGLASIFNFGQLGVQLFFVASAVTLCLSTAQRAEASPVNFYIRRFFRIAPLFYLAIPFYFVWRVYLEYRIAGVIIVPVNYNIRGIVETVFFVHGFDPKNFNFVVPGGWSIAVEMAFYAIFPIIYSLQAKFRGVRFSVLAVAVFAVCVLIDNFLIYGVQPILIEKGFIRKFAIEYDFLSASIINQIIVFFIGIIVYQQTYVKKNALKFANGLVAIAVPLAMLSFYLLNSRNYVRTPFTGAVYPVFAAAAFGLLSLKLSTVAEFRGLISKLLIQIGRVSFSMYILHFFVIDMVFLIFSRSLYAFVRIPELRLIVLYFSVIGLTFLLSKLTYVYIEKPGINIGNNLIARLDERVEQTLSKIGQEKAGGGA